MSRWWVGVAVIAGCLGRPALAQNPPTGVPTPYGATRTPPEPIPEATACPTPPPPMIPGPLTPGMAPAGPADCLSLPASSGGAFQCENFPTEFGVYFSVGAQALQRQKLGAGGIALTDVTRRDPTSDTGVTPLVSAPIAQRFNDITPNMAFGPRFTLGVLSGSDMIEVTGYYIGRNSQTVQNVAPGRISAFFHNAPLGFEGNNGLFVEADAISSTLKNELGNVELNYRYTSAAVSELELILGLRFFDVKERLSTTVDDDGHIHPANALGLADAQKVATYAASTQNRLLAPQLGFEWNQGLLRWLSVGATFKGAWGINFSDVGHSLSRGDGLSAFNVNRHDTIYSSIYEMGAFAEIHILERARVRAGYNAIWFVHMNAVVDQYEFDLSKPQGKINNEGSVLYHGPMVELQILF